MTFRAYDMIKSKATTVMTKMIKNFSIVDIEE